MQSVQYPFESLVRTRQEPLRQRYRTMPDQAFIQDRACAGTGTKESPFYSSILQAGQTHNLNWQLGIHHAIGGFHDAPNPGDLLCAALAACQLATLRMIADRLGIAIERATVEVIGNLDVRGTLMVADVPVGFQNFRSTLQYKASICTHPDLVEALQSNVERCCVVQQTLLHGATIECSFELME